MLRLNPSIDRAQAEFFNRLHTLPPKEQEAVHAAIVCGARRDLVEEIPDTLLQIDPVLCGLWSVWQETLSTEAWRAVARLVFTKGELLTAAQTGSDAA